jgi:hypothetical protein
LVAVVVAHITQVQAAMAILPVLARTCQQAAVTEPTDKINILVELVVTDPEAI